MTIYIVTGPPGAGKTTICDELAKRFDRGFHLHCDDIYNMVKGGYKPPWDDVDDQLKNLKFAASSKLIETYLKAGFHVAVDYVFSLSQLQSFVSNLSNPIVLAVLLPSLKTNIERDKNRKWVVGKERVSNYHEEFAQLKILSPYTIDTTSIKPNEVVDKILEMSPVDRFLVTPDWTQSMSLG